MMPSFEGNLLAQWHEICSQETRNSTLSYGENSKSLSHLGMVRYRVVTDRRTGRITMAGMRLALRAVARKKCDVEQNCGVNNIVTCVTV